MKSSYALFRSTCAMQCQSYTSYTCSIKTGCVNAIPTAGANSTPGKQARFPLPCQSAHTISPDNLLLYFEGAFDTLLFMSLAS